jgi:hypothetical protein
MERTTRQAGGAFRGVEREEGPQTLEEAETDALRDWDPWWPVTARPQALRMLGFDPSTWEPKLELVHDTDRYDRALAATSIEGALVRLEGVMSSAALLSENTRAEQVVAGLLGLANALRQPRHVMAELLGEVGSSSAMSALSKMEGLYDRLAHRAEELATRAEHRDFAEVRAAVRHLLSEVETALTSEVDVVVDVYWLDAGVVD